MARHRLLHTITTLDRGGAELQLLPVLSALDPDRFEICLAYLKGAGSLRPDFERAGIRVVPFSMWAPLDPLLIVRLALFIVRERFDLVHTHLFKADVHAGIAARLAGTPALVCSKHNEDPYLKRLLPGILGRRLGRRVDRTIVLSHAVERFMIEVGAAQPTSTRVVPYGIDLDNFDQQATGPSDRPQIRKELGLDEDTFLFGCVARLEPQKAHSDLIEATALLARVRPDFRLVLIGEGSLRSRLEAQVARLGLKKHVHFAGLRTDIPRLLGALDGFVLSSHWEGFGLVLLEAMAAQLPIVATRVGAIGEVVADGETGLLVPACEPSSLAEALATLLADPRGAQTMGRAGRERAEAHFGLDRTVAQLSAIYEELLA